LGKKKRKQKRVTAKKTTSKPVNQEEKGLKALDPRTSKLITGLINIAFQWIEKPDKVLNFAFGITWIYIFIRVFITDIDLELFSKLENVTPSTYITGRILFFLAFIALYWNTLGTKQFLKDSLLFLLFPIFPVAFKLIKFITWTIPKYLVTKQDIYTAFYYIDSIIINIVQSKTRTTIFTFFLISIFLMIKLQDLSLSIPITIFIALQLYHLKRRYDETFSPIKVFQLQIEEYKPKSNFSRDEFDKNVEKAIEKKTRKIERKIASMEYFLMVGEFSRVLNKKLINVLNAQSYFKSFLFKCIYSFIFAMIIFGGINYCLYKIDHNNFIHTGSPEYFEFFYYSFFTIFPDGSDIEPLSRVAKTIRMSGVSVGVVVNLLLLTVLITVRSARYKKNLLHLSNWSQSHATEVAFYFEEKYGQKTAEGLKYLLETGSKTAEFLTELKSTLNKN